MKKLICMTLLCGFAGSAGLGLSGCGKKKKAPDAAVTQAETFKAKACSCQPDDVKCRSEARAQYVELMKGFKDEKVSDDTKQKVEAAIKAATSCLRRRPAGARPRQAPKPRK